MFMAMDGLMQVVIVKCSAKGFDQEHRIKPLFVRKSRYPDGPE